MCGIAGFVGPGDRDDLAAMMAALVHRGPDGEGDYIEPRTQRAFSGIGASPSSTSPAARSRCGTPAQAIGVVFNGEIYNHRELRAELEARGHRFRTDHSDTEVLIHGYAEWGEDLPARLNGMFAFCIYDRARKRLFLARDRFGEKPLYFARQGDLFAFASELSAIAAPSQFRGAAATPKPAETVGLRLLARAERHPGGLREVAGRLRRWSSNRDRGELRTGVTGNSVWSRTQRWLRAAGRRTGRGIARPSVRSGAPAAGRPTCRLGFF